MKTYRAARMSSLRDSNLVLPVFLGLKSQAITCHRSAVKEKAIPLTCV